MMAPDIRDIHSDITGLGRTAIVKLEAAGYESLTDLQGVTKEELVGIEQIGPVSAQRLLRYVERHVDDGAENVSAGSEEMESPTPSLTELESRIEAHYTPVQSHGGNWYRCVRQTDDGGICGAMVHYSGERDGPLWDHEQTHRQPTGSSETESEDESRIAQTKESDEDLPSPDTRDGLDEAAFETSWESIPDNSRLDKQLLLKIRDIKEPHSDRKSEILVCVDRTGIEVNLDIWETHGIDIDWTEGAWYAIANSRGTVWEDDAEETRKRLSSTSALDVVSLSDETEQSPQAATSTQVNQGAETPQEEREGASTASAGHSDRGSEGGSSSDDPVEDENGIFEEIVSDFDDL